MRAREVIRLYRGDDELRRVQLLQYEQPLNLSPYVRADLMAVSDGQVVLEMSSTDNTIQFLDPANGVILLDFNHRLTANATWRRANYDLQLIDRLGRVMTVMTGIIDLTYDITKVQYAR